MRLICPNCDARYEVPDSVMPPEGRDVQCSNCDQMWFQEHPDHPLEDLDAAPEDDFKISPPEIPSSGTGEDASDRPARRALDPAVAEVLRAEAELEAKARQQERGPIESQPELGLPEGGGDAARRAAHARAAVEAVEAVEAAQKAQSQKAPVPKGLVPQGSRRDLLPDIEEINSTLRAKGSRALNGEAEALSQGRHQEKRNARRGFLLALFLVALCLSAYVYAPQISARVPEAAAPLDGYVAAIDIGRAWLDDQVATLNAWLNQFTAQGVQ